MPYYDIDVYSRPITTTSADAQLWFDRGLIWTYGYSHEEAVACFKRALEHDPNCAMAHWGVAYAIGLNDNLTWEVFDPDSKAMALGVAFEATGKTYAREVWTRTQRIKAPGTPISPTPCARPIRPIPTIWKSQRSSSRRS